MTEEKIAMEATQEVDEAIMHLAKIRLAKRCIVSEERYWVDKIKSLISPASCDKILTQREGSLISRGSRISGMTGSSTTSTAL